MRIIFSTSETHWIHSQVFFTFFFSLYVRCSVSFTELGRAIWIGPGYKHGDGPLSNWYGWSYELWPDHTRATVRMNRAADSGTRHLPPRSKSVSSSIPLSFYTMPMISFLLLLIPTCKIFHQFHCHMRILKSIHLSKLKSVSVPSPRLKNQNTHSLCFRLPSISFFQGFRLLNFSDFRKCPHKPEEWRFRRW